MAISSESTKKSSTAVLSCQVSTDVLENKDRGPFEGGEELAVSGSTGAIGSDSSATPSRGSPVSGAGSRSLPGVPAGGVGATGYLEPIKLVNREAERAFA